MALRDFDSMFAHLMNDTLYDAVRVVPYIGRSRFPNVDLYTRNNSNNSVVSVELPGLSKEDVTVVVRDNSLVIEGEKKQSHEEEDKNTYYYRENYYGKFRRVVQLPTDVDENNITAKFENGVLNIELPKKQEVEPESRTIHIS